MKTNKEIYELSKTKISTSSNKEEVVVLCANVRTNNSPIDIGRKNWYFRAPLFKSWLSEANADIIGFQEATKLQMNYLTKILEDYDYVYKYRDNKENSECCPIFFKKDRFSLLDVNSFWLSSTPDIMSKGWNAACFRICSYAILKDKNTNKEIVVFNTHLDHISIEARINGINLVLKKIEEFNFMDKSSILMGDMNDFDNSETINALFTNFKDAALIAKDHDDKMMYHCTYQNYGDGLDEKRIDYFAIRNLSVNSYKVITTLYDKGRCKDVYASDHFPILMKVKL